ncbi:MAG: GAF domain-containing protein [Proteobacteria bacterium]|nr:GAF domain-containing protein [Pseudomonadota bacterium]
MNDDSSVSPVPDQQPDRLMILAALFENDFPIDWLIELSGVRISHALSVLNQAKAEGLLHEKAAGIFSFTDTERKAELRRGLSIGERAEYRRRITDILVRELAEDSPHVHVLAKNLLHIDNNTDGCRCLLTAGDWHLKSSDFKTALGYYIKTIEDLRDVRSKDADRMFIEAAIKSFNTSSTESINEWYASVLENAHQRAVDSNNASHLALLKLYLATSHWLNGHYSAAHSYFETGWRMAGEIADPQFRRSISSISAFYQYCQGRFADAVRIYEDSLRDVEHFPQGMFPLFASTVVGFCYAVIGQVNQGLGLLDSIRANCLSQKWYEIYGFVILNIIDVLMVAGQVDDAVRILSSLKKEMLERFSAWNQSQIMMLRSFCYYLKMDHKKSAAYLKDYFRMMQTDTDLTRATAYKIILARAMRFGDYPKFDELQLEQEIDKAIKIGNSFFKGLGYRAKAELQMQSQCSPTRILKTLDRAQNALEESGYAIQVAETLQERAHYCMNIGREEEARRIVQELESQARTPTNGRHETLLDQILQMGQDLVAIRNSKDLVKHIILTVNAITGSERGAIFILNKNAEDSEFILRGAINLTAEEIDRPEFESSLKTIRETVVSGRAVIRRSRISGGEREPYVFNIRTCVCVPMILKNEIVGVLYHDNRFLSSAFKETDLKTFTYFAALAAIAMDNSDAYDEIERLNRKLNEEKQYYKEQHLESIYADGFIGKSQVVKRFVDKAMRVADTDSTVLILGETGVGKELAAGMILRHSSRRDKPFIRVNCSAFPETLIASELFGYEKGAFTGADRVKPGRFELADSGTLFLDEIGDISIEIQVRLLRVLQNREFERIGGTRTLRSDFRLIVATNRDLKKMVKAGTFREDLYYRLNVFPIRLPTLRERKGDIPLLTLHFLKTFTKNAGKTVSRIPESEMNKLLRYDWPGNVRELKNIVERGVIMSSSSDFRVPERFDGRAGGKSEINDSSLQEMDKQYIKHALEQTGWKIKGPGGTAEFLKINSSTLRSRMKKLGIERPAR